MIPRLIHLWWSDRTPPETLTERLGYWRLFGEPDGWEPRLWYDEPELAEVFALADETAGNVLPSDRIRHRANLVRWHLLAAHGGVWADTDVIPLRSLEPFAGRDRPFSASLAGWPIPCVIGGPAGHPLWARVLAAVRGRRGSSPFVSGRHVLNAVRGDDLDREPPGRFLDVDVRHRPVPLPADGVRYTRHLWATSHLRQEGAVA